MTFTRRIYSQLGFRKSLSSLISVQQLALACQRFIEILGTVNPSVVCFGRPGRSVCGQAGKLSHMGLKYVYEMLQDPLLLSCENCKLPCSQKLNVEVKLWIRCRCYAKLFFLLNPPHCSQTTATPESQNQQWRPPEKRRGNEARRSPGE